MGPPKAVTLATLKVLRVFAAEPSTNQYGLALIRASGLKGGSLYPILSRLENEGWIAGTWEDIDEQSAGRRRRRYYRLTTKGQAEALAVLAETVGRLAIGPISAVPG